VAFELSIHDLLFTCSKISVASDPTRSRGRSQKYERVQEYCSRGVEGQMLDSSRGDSSPWSKSDGAPPCREDATVGWHERRVREEADHTAFVDRLSVVDKKEVSSSDAAQIS